jgi:dihydrofolate reductase
VGEVLFTISMSLDGYIAAPDDKPSQGLGKGGEILHDWAHGGEWGRFSPTGVDREVLNEMVADRGAGIVGRRMFDIAGAWGGNPGGPAFVLTHEPPEEWTKPDSPFTFVTDGVESALKQARAVANGKDIVIGGGASVAQQFLRAGLVDVVQIHLVPVLLGGGIRLFEHLGDEQIKLERLRVIESPYVTHLKYRVIKEDSPTGGE